MDEIEKEKSIFISCGSKNFVIEMKINKNNYFEN